MAILTRFASMTVTSMPGPTFQAVIQILNRYWGSRGCVLIQSLDIEVGAGTFHPATFLRALGPEPWAAAFVQPCRRPGDGRYGENPNRLQHYYQYQVVMKPNPDNIVDLYIDSLKALGIDPLVHDLRFVEDNWESPTLGAWGLGWEVWLNGMEVTQFTYFQQAGGLECKPVTGEITYGLERLAMYLQNVDNVYDLVWTVAPHGTVTYGDVFHQNEVEQSTYNFEHADVPVPQPPQLRPAPRLAEFLHRLYRREQIVLRRDEKNMLGREFELAIRQIQRIESYPCAAQAAAYGRAEIQLGNDAIHPRHR